MFFCDVDQDFYQLLIRASTTSGIDEALIFHAAPIRDIRQFARPCPLILQKATAQRAENQKRHVMKLRHFRQFLSRRSAQSEKQNWFDTISIPFLITMRR